MSKGRIIGQIVNCDVCDKIWDDYKTARQNGYNHHKKTGHRVAVETTTIFWYDKDIKEVK